MKNNIDTEKIYSIKKKHEEIDIVPLKMNPNLKKFLFALIILNIILIIIIVILSYFVIKSLKKSDKVEIINKYTEKEKNENTNFISGIYSVESGKKLQIFNPEKVSLKEDDYNIEILSGNNNLRNLGPISINNGSYTPSESGYINLKIIFKVTLNNLNEVFKDIKELINVDLSHFEMENVLSMNSTFSGCLNLNNINFEGINSNNLIDMAYTFENCKNLKNLDLSPIKSGKLRIIKGIFSECDNLENINISSFEKIDQNLFEGIKSKPNIIANENTSGEILNIFHNLFNINITIIETPKKENHIIKDCILGENEKCKECSSFHSKSCLSCNNGYYIPFNENNYPKCLPCNKTIKNCFTCFGDINYIVCSSCYPKFILKNNKCLNSEIKKCIIGEKEKCKECEEDELMDKCKSCNPGYFLSDFTNKTECQSCNIIDYCNECNEENGNLICKKCKDGFTLINNQCIEEECVIGKNEKCSSCKNEIGRKKECKTCNLGYYMSEINSPFCTKCSIENCKTCSKFNGNEVCLECKDTFEPVKNELGLTIICKCPINYTIKNGICIRPGNWIKMLLDVYCSFNKGVANILGLGFNIDKNEIDVYVNGTKVELLDVGIYNEYQFNTSGIYVVEINIKKTLTTMNGMFRNCYFIYSISFLPGFDTSKVTEMGGMIFDMNVESIDMKYLDVSSLRDVRDFINENYWYKRTDKLDKFIIDLSSFDTSKVTRCSGMFQNLHKDTIIIISNKFTKCKEQFSFENKVINIDEIECQKQFENCEECKGTKESLICNKCKLGYKLNKDDYCIKEKCDVGEKEKCLECKSEEGKENDCLSCNEGYYLPLNSNNHKVCAKCNIEKCKICNDQGICTQCKDFYEPLKSNGIIIGCNPICELGDGIKCLTCNLESKNKCGSCNWGYKLMKNGTCIKIENSFIASYNVSKINKPIHLMNLRGNRIDFSNIEMYINNVKVIPYLIYSGSPQIHDKDCYVSYKFPNLGLKTVKIIINQILSNMVGLFSFCEDLVTINFAETFDTSKVQCMTQMFYYCTSLISVNVSSFNTSSVNNFYQMFYGNDKLTSLDLSNFETKYACGYTHLFMSL